MSNPREPVSAGEILGALPAAFEAARNSGELLFFESQEKNVVSHGRPFNLRVCPALLNKEKEGKQGEGSPEPKRVKVAKKEPFRPPYVPELYVGSLAGIEGEGNLSVLLNKYSVLSRHFLLCPQEEQPQALPPSPPQLAQVYNLLLAASRDPVNPKRLLAFYNGGPGAGASQTWRHVQFVEVPQGTGAPVEQWVSGLTVERKDKPFYHPSVPYLHILHHLPDRYSFPVPATDDSNERLVDALAPALMATLDIMFDALRRGGVDRSGGWNLLMTLDHLHLIPRSAPSFTLPSPNKPLEVNALGYAGMLLVKSPEELAVLEEATNEPEGTTDEAGLMRILAACGVPRDWAIDTAPQEDGQLAS